MMGFSGKKVNKKTGQKLKVFMASLCSRDDQTFSGRYLKLPPQTSVDSLDIHAWIVS